VRVSICTTAGSSAYRRITKECSGWRSPSPPA
jgi:hypothetical protein